MPLTNFQEQAGYLDEMRVWDYARSDQEMLDGAGQNLTGSESGLLAFWNFDNGTATDLTGNGHDGTLEGNARDCADAASQTNTSRKWQILFPEFLYHPSGAIARISTSSYTIQDWIRITWLWEETFRLQVAVNDSQFEAMPFITAGVLGTEEFDGTLAQEVWLPAFSEVTVGAVYRTTNRCYTLSSINGATKLFSGLTPQNMLDGSRNGQATREITFPAINQPGRLVFNYSDTVFHAILPLGESLNASSTAALNQQIVPDLCDGAQLQKSSTAVQVTDSNPSRNGGTGSQNQYDKVYNTMFTVWPGVFTYQWADVNSAVSNHTIQVASGFPTNTMDTFWQIEDKQGYRLDTNGTRILDSGLPPTTLATLPATGDEFPGSPAAHYNYLYATDPNQTIPVDLDADDSDQWFFQRQSFADNSAVNTSTGRFTSNGGGQSVLVYSYRTNASEAATGDTTREALAVRVVNSIPLSGNTQEGGFLSSQNYRQLHITSTNGLYAEATAYGGNHAVGNNLDRTFDFWLKLDGTAADTNQNRVVFEIDEQGISKLVQFGLRSLTNTVNPGGFYYTVDDYSQSINDLDVEFDRLKIDDQWHHWAMVIGSTGQSFYLDGNLVTNLGSPFPYPEPTVGINVQSYGYSKKLGGGWLEGSLDNWRIWTAALTTDQIRAAMMNFLPNLGGLQPVFAVSFDLTPNGATIPKDSGTASGDIKVVQANGSDGDALAALELQTEDGPAEVATRLDSKLDTAELGSGFLTQPHLQLQSGSLQSRRARGSMGRSVSGELARYLYRRQPEAAGRLLRESVSRQPDQHHRAASQCGLAPRRH